MSFAPPVHPNLLRLLALPKIDAHCHVLEPARFPYADDVAYRPAGQEMGDLRSFEAVMHFHGVHHALLVGPNSGYGTDNRCLLDALAQGQGRFKAIAVVPNDCAQDELVRLRSAGVVGLAFNASLHGAEHYAGIAPLLQRMASLGLWAQWQVHGDQLVELMPLIMASDVPLMVDHCGRPDLAMGLQSRGFQNLLALGREGRAVVKLSGFAKFSSKGYPFEDARPVVDALAKNFGLQACLWASDWPYLKAPCRLDYGPMLALYADLFSLSECEQIMWQTPKQLLGFDAPSARQS